MRIPSIVITCLYPALALGAILLLGRIIANNKKPYLFAHRGFSNEVPDDSLAGFKLAASLDYGLDCDLWPTAKNDAGEFKLAVSHDNHLGKVAGLDTNISDMTPEEVASVTITSGSNIESYPNEHIPMLEEVLDITSHNDLRIIVEMKGKSWTEEQCLLLLDELKSHNMLDKVIVNALYIASLRSFLSCAQDYPHVPDTLYTILHYEDFPKKLEVARKAGISMVSIRSSIIQKYSDVILPAIKDSGLKLLTWTAGEEDERSAVEKMKALGIRYIATNIIL